VAASPLPIVAVLIMLITKRARPGSLVMAASWVLGNLLIVSIAVAFAAQIPKPRLDPDLGWEGIFTFLLGVGLVTTGLLARRARRRSPGVAATPAWVDSVDNLSPVGGGAVAFLNATTSPKNLALAIASGRLISQSGLRESQMWAAVAFYVLIASLSIVVPVAFYFIGGQRSVATLRRWRALVTANGAAVMEITLLVLGVLMSAKGLYNLFT
jgi:hypothetical protein